MVEENFEFQSFEMAQNKQYQLLFSWSIFIKVENEREVMLL